MSIGLSTNTHPLDEFHNQDIIEQIQPASPNSHVYLYLSFLYLLLLSRNLNRQWDQWNPL